MAAAITGRIFKPACKAGSNEISNAPHPKKNVGCPPSWFIISGRKIIAKITVSPSRNAHITSAFDISLLLTCWNDCTPDLFSQPSYGFVNFG